MLKLKYWCKSKFEKEEMLDILNENERKYQEELQQKYNNDNLFKNKEQNINKNQDKVEDKQLIPENTSILYHIRNYIKNIFRSNK